MEEQYLDLMDWLENLLDRADAGKNHVYLADFLAHARAFKNHAQLDSATIHRLLAEQGVPLGILQWFDTEQWWNYRNTDLATWTPEQRDNLRAWLDFAKMIQIVATEADPLLNQHYYSYDLSGSLSGETVAVYGGTSLRYTYLNNDASHLGGLYRNFSQVYAYDHLNRRVVKDSSPERVIYLYDLAGNLIAEANLADGKLIRQWFYVGSQRVAMIYPVSGGRGIPPCGGCSLAGEADGGAAFLGFMGLVLVGIGVFRKNRKYQVTGLTFLGGVLFFLLMPNAQSQTPLPEQIYYYHNDHLGTPKVVTNQAGAAVWDADYSPFGEISSYVINSLSVDQPFRFPGQYQDSLTGLNYNWNRYYMPEVGRYNRVDPHYNSSLESYLYAINNPIIFSDEEGLESKYDWLFKHKWPFFGMPCAYEQSDIAKRFAEESGFPGLGGGKQDAYRHCLWGCFMVTNCGLRYATWAGWEHEAFDTGQNPWDYAMDTHNNVEARACGLDSNKCPSQGSNPGRGGDCKCKTCCLEKLSNGKLWF